MRWARAARVLTSAAAMRLLIVEDEPTLAHHLLRGLRGEGYEADHGKTVAEAGALAAAGDYDLAVIDLKLPDGSGLDLLRRWRAEEKHLPVLVLTARDAIGDKVAGLDSGADDYLTKPFGVGELLARVRANLRRRARLGGGGPTTHEFGPVTVDLAARLVHRDGAQVHLTPIEFRLLAHLLANAGKVLTHRQILREVWGPGYAESSHSLRVYMSQLRRKLEQDPARPRHFLTETAIGYRFVADPGP